MRNLLAALGAASALFSGCGGEGGGSGGGAQGPDPVPAVLPATVLVPRAASAGGAAGLVVLSATDVILDPLTHGEAISTTRSFLSPHKFEGPSHDEFEIDLDALNKGGQDRFPHVSGVILVTLDGLVQGTRSGGEASCSALLEAGTEIVAVDPQSGVEAVLSPGALWSCLLDVTWEFTDPENGIIIATQTSAISIASIVVTDGDDVVTVGVAGGREVVLAIAKVDGQVIQERQIQGALTITIDDGRAPVEVVIEFQNDGLILVTIGAGSFGPLTEPEFRKFFRVEFV